MSRIGKKPIPVPQGVKVSINGSAIEVQGPKGKLETRIPQGVSVEQKDGNLVAVRENDSQAAIHGLCRPLLNNAVTGVTTGWTGELETLSIGYKAELKGKDTVVFNLGYSHPIAMSPPSGITVPLD